MRFNTYGSFLSVFQKAKHQLYFIIYFVSPNQMISLHYSTFVKISQWDDCYFDYQTFKQILKFVRKAYLIKRKIEDKSQVELMPIIHKSVQNIETTHELVSGIKNNIIDIVQCANQLFFKFQRINRQVEFLFFQIKIHQLENTAKKYQKWTEITEQNKSQFAQLLQNVHTQAQALFEFNQINFLSESKIIKKHLRIFQKFKMKSPHHENSKVLRCREQSKNLLIRFQKLFQIKLKQKYQLKRFNKIQNIQSNPTVVSFLTYLFGVTNGINIALLCFVITLITIDSLHVQTYEQVTTYPIWRAVSHTLLILWMVGLNLFFFQKYRIDYQTILSIKKRSQSANFMLNYASIITFVYLILYLIYLLHVFNLIFLNSASQIAFLPLLIWGIFLILLLLPFRIFHYQGRFLLLKQILKAIASPFIGTSLMSFFIIQQFGSFIIPFEDTIYAICFYIRTDFNFIQHTNSCQFLLHSGEIFGIVVFIYKIIILTVMAWKKRQLRGTKQLSNIIRNFLFVIIMIVSFSSQSAPNLVYFWYAIILPISIACIYLDFKDNLELLQTGSYFIVRKDILYPKKLVYLFAFGNIFLKFAFILTISQHILQRWSKSGYLLNGIAIMQIIRRLLWNSIFISNIHRKNKEKFEIRMNDEETEKLLSINQESQQRKLQNQRKQQELKNINERIKSKKQTRKQIEDWINQKNSVIKEIQTQTLLFQ